MVIQKVLILSKFLATSLKNHKPSDNNYDTPIIETLKTNTKSVPIIIPERDSVMDECVPNVNTVRNPNKTKVLTKVI